MEDTLIKCTVFSPSLFFEREAALKFSLLEKWTKHIFEVAFESVWPRKRVTARNARQG